jgi:ABC-type spermidine/putrescine transport system permease subunit I
VVFFIWQTKIKSEVSRRWKASSLVSILFGLLIHLCILVIIVFGLISDVNVETMSTDLGRVFIEIFSATIGLAAIITMPTIIIGTLFAYYNFWKTGDRLIKKYWRNPKVHYDENAKPPFLKF